MTAGEPLIELDLDWGGSWDADDDSDLTPASCGTPLGWLRHLAEATTTCERCVAAKRRGAGAA